MRYSKTSFVSSSGGELILNQSSQLNLGKGFPPSSELNFSALVVDGTLIADFSDQIYSIHAVHDYFGAYDGYYVFLNDGRPVTEATIYLSSFGEVRHVNLSGTNFNDTIVGMWLSDSLSGLDGNDILSGGYGADTVDGGDDDDVVLSAFAQYWWFPGTWDTGLEIDTLIGGAGNDTLVAGYGDNVDGGLGTDLFAYSFLGALAGVNADFSAAFSGGTAFVGGGAITGLESYSEIRGSAFNDTIITGDAVQVEIGNTHLGVWGGDGNDTLTGGEQTNTLFGEGGDDTLYGLVGADTMTGGLGNDIYYVDNIGDVVVEGKTEGTADYVYSSVTFNSAGIYVETIELTGTAKINALGNERANTLIGNSGSNSLDGRAGNDTMIGKGGNDTYIVRDAGDVVIEQAGEGTDVVKTNISYTLTANVEQLVLNGTNAINGTGNVQGNRLTGNEAANVLSGLNGSDVIYGRGGDDTIIGGRGNDTLWGEGGADRFVFEKPALNNLDILKDFVSGTDDLVFKGSDYGFVAGHVLTASELVMGTAPVGSGAQFYFDAATHTLYFDDDGTGAHAATALAVFDNAATPTVDDFTFV